MILVRFFEKLKNTLPTTSLFVVSLLVFMASQYKEGVTNYITRFVDFSNYMLAHGVTLFPMVSATEAYPDYTVINTLLIYLFSLPFGKLSVTSLGLPYCIAAALTVVFTYKLAALHDKKWGLFGAVFTLFTWEFLQEVHFLALDIYPAFATIFCFYLVYAADFYRKKSYLFLVPIGFVIGFLFRGPIGLITPALIVSCYYLLNKKWGMFFIFGFISGLLLVVCTALLAWTAYLQGGIPFMKDVLDMQGFGRIVNSHAPRLYFYFTLGVANYSLTVLFAITVLVKKFRTIFRVNQEPILKLLLHLSVWFFIIILFFTIPNSKKARYILSITPAISLIAAYIFVEKSTLFANTIKTLRNICTGIPIVGLIILFLIFIYNFFAGVPLQPNYLGALVGFSLLIGSQKIIKKYFETNPNFDLIIMLFGAVAFLFLNCFIIYPISYHLELLHETEPRFLPFW